MVDADTLYGNWKNLYISKIFESLAALQKYVKFATVLSYAIHPYHVEITEHNQLNVVTILLIGGFVFNCLPSLCFDKLFQILPPLCQYNSDQGHPGKRK